MFIFLRLLLAHFIADFPLQVSSIYGLKLQKTWGAFLHSAIVAAVCVLLCLPFLGISKIWVIILWIWLLHGLQDWAKVTYCEKTRKDNLWIFMLDQLLHMGLISIVFLIGELNHVTLPEQGNSVIAGIYCNDRLVILLMGYIFLCYGGLFMNLYVREDFFKMGRLEIPAWREKYLGMLERALLGTAVILEGVWLILLPAYWLILYLSGKLKEKKQVIGVSVNMVISVLVGIVVRIAANQIK